MRPGLPRASCAVLEWMRPWPVGRARSPGPEDVVSPLEVTPEVGAGLVDRGAAAAAVSDDLAVVVAQTHSHCSFHSARGLALVRVLVSLGGHPRTRRCEVRTSRGVRITRWERRSYRWRRGISGGDGTGEVAPSSSPRSGKSAACCALGVRGHLGTSLPSPQPSPPRRGGQRRGGAHPGRRAQSRTRGNG